MKYLPLIWAGIWRKRSRAILMLLQIVSAFLLFGLLQGFNSSIKQAIAGTHSDRLYVASSVSIGDPLPISMLPRVQAVPGVKAVTPLVQFPGQYQKPGQGIPITGVDVDAFFQMFPDYVIDKAQREALLRTRTGAAIGSVVAKRFELRKGDQNMAGAKPDFIGTVNIYIADQPAFDAAGKQHTKTLVDDVPHFSSVMPNAFPTVIYAIG